MKGNTLSSMALENQAFAAGSSSTGMSVVGKLACLVKNGGIRRLETMVRCPGMSDMRIADCEKAETLQVGGTAQQMVSQ